jgi:hypothetical protein
MPSHLGIDQKKLMSSEGILFQVRLIFRPESMGRKTGRAWGWRAALLLVTPLLAAQSPAPAPPPPAAVIHHLAPGEAAGVLGAKVVTAKGEEIGRIVDVIVDQAGHPRAAVIDFGGFMGIGNRKIAVDWKSLHFAAGQPESAVVCDLTPDQIKAIPEYQETAGKPASVAAPSHASPAMPPAAKPPPS